MLLMHLTNPYVKSYYFFVAGRSLERSSSVSTLYGLHGKMYPLHSILYRGWPQLASRALRCPTRGFPAMAKVGSLALGSSKALKYSWTNIYLVDSLMCLFLCLTKLRLFCLVFISHCMLTVNIVHTTVSWIMNSHWIKFYGILTTSLEINVSLLSLCFLQFSLIYRHVAIFNRPERPRYTKVCLFLLSVAHNLYFSCICNSE